MAADPTDSVQCKCPHCAHVGTFQLPTRVKGAAGQCPSCRRWFTVARPRPVEKAPEPVKAEVPPAKKKEAKA